MNRLLLLFSTLLLQTPLGNPTEGTLSGKVLHKDGSPATGVSVTLGPFTNEAKSLQLSRLVTSDALGGYRFQDVPSGRYRVQAMAEGMETYDPPGSDIETLETINVVAGKAETGPTFTVLVIAQSSPQADDVNDPDARKKDTYQIYSALVPKVPMIPLIGLADVRNSEETVR